MLSVHTKLYAGFQVWGKVKLLDSNSTLWRIAMKVNVGGVDRIVRIVAGLALIGWVLFANGPTWAWIGIAPLATGLLNFCPAYSILGISTCKAK